MPNARVKELYRVEKRLNDRTDERVLRLSGHIERTENKRIVKRVYLGKGMGSRLAGRPWKSWIDINEFECWAH